jgi:propionyl-CoA carboxylase beta chain
VLALPTAEIAVMGAEGAANVIFRKEIAAAADPQGLRAEKILQFSQSFMNPFVAAGYGYVDDIIEPRYARIELIRSLEMNLRKREDRPAKKHGNIPL